MDTFTQEAPSRETVAERLVDACGDDVLSIRQPPRRGLDESPRMHDRRLAEVFARLTAPQRRAPTTTGVFVPQQPTLFATENIMSDVHGAHIPAAFARLQDRPRHCLQDSDHERHRRLAEWIQKWRSMPPDEFERMVVDEHAAHRVDDLESEE